MKNELERALAASKAIEERATEGPWEVCESQLGKRVKFNQYDYAAIYSFRDRGTAEFIAHARTWLPIYREILSVAIPFIRQKLVCVGKRHDCPSCNGVDAQETLDDLNHLAAKGLEGK